MNVKRIVDIAKELDKAQITWGIGGSMLLAYYDIVDHVNDIDIIVEPEHIDKAIHVLQKIGKEKEVERHKPFATVYFHKFRVETATVDMMAQFQLEHTNGLYTYDFSNYSVKRHNYLGEVLPFCLLEDWFVLYQLMPRREQKVRYMEKYFRKNGISHTNVLQNACKQNLPASIEMKIYAILEENHRLR